MAERREDLRAADVDRQFVADRLKSALDEGRLSLHEYDDRLRETYAARTYGDLDKLLSDLPRAGRSQVVPSAQRFPSQPHAAAAPSPRGIPKWVIATWSSWITVSLIVNAIWLATVVSGGGASYWPIWVMLPWGAILLAGTVTGLAGRDARQAGDRTRDERKRERRERRGR